MEEQKNKKKEKQETKTTCFLRIKEANIRNYLFLFKLNTTRK